jgi:hypothetical protein
MHEIIDRFVGRYEVWRRSVPLRNPLNIPALVLATSIAQAVYQIVTSYHVAWGALVLLSADVVFLVAHLKRSPWAWLVLPVLGCGGANSVAICSCFRFSRLPVGHRPVCDVFSPADRRRLYRVGLCNSTTLLRLCGTPHLTNR